MMAELYPNPASNYFTIALSNTQNKTLTTRIVDIQGRVVFEETAGSGDGFKKTIDTSAFQSGFYTVQISSAGDVFTKKLVIRK